MNGAVDRAIRALRWGLMLVLVPAASGCALFLIRPSEIRCPGALGSCSIWDNASAYGGASGDVSGPTDDADMGVEGSVGSGVAAIPGTTVEATARYLPRSTEVFDKTHTAAFVEARYPVFRGEGPLRVTAGAGIGVVRESSSFSGDYALDRIDGPVAGRPGGAAFQEGDGAVTSPMFRLGTGIMWTPPTSRWAPFADIGYELYTASDLNNKAVIRAGVRYMFGTPRLPSGVDEDEGSRVPRR